MDDKLRIAETKNEQANVAYNSGKFSNALYMYEMAINQCPNNAKYYSNRSACYFMLQNYIKAQADAQKAIDLDPTYLKCYTRIIRCCLYDGNLKYASATVLRAKEKFPTEEIISKLLETVNLLEENFKNYQYNFERGKYSEALNFIEKCLNENESSNCALFLLAKANCLIYLNEFENAKKIADGVLAANKNDENAIFIKTCAQCYQKDAQAALSILKTLKSTLPDHSKTNQLYVKTTLIYNNIEKIEAAIQNCSYEEAYDLAIKTLKIDPYYMVTNKRLRRRKIDIAQGNRKLYWKGVSDCDEFMNLFGEDLEILQAKVKLLMDLEEYDDAVEVYEKILQLENNEINEKNLDKAKGLLNNQNDNYEILLRLSGTLTEAKIKKAANDLKFRYHPDRNRKVSLERKKQLEEKLIRVTKAEQWLLNKINK